ncbi:uncharacterized protein LOC119740149 [Patiria miniata]|uniref:HECT-type E3 ubiquitin transferase n=1 Tax=Patiria miniata TaxID=46514 RepID=A0A914B648_PATMI|nr:uncharacterized protein LOC119740149 [Patiria miniata]
MAEQRKDVYWFMHEERGIPEAQIDRMKQEKIDETVIPFMTDQNLQGYLPLFGDRLAVINYCKSEQKHGRGPEENKLIQKLRLKMMNRRGQTEARDTSQHVPKLGNKNARKDTRRVDFGWLNYNSKEKSYKQVRKQHGGGTRQMTVKKDCIAHQLKTVAEGLYFKEGQSSKGPLHKFETALADFTQHEISDNETVEEKYNAAHMPVLRFYLLTKEKDTKAAKQETDEEDSADFSVSDDEQYLDVGQEVQVETSDEASNHQAEDADARGMFEQTDTPTIQFRKQKQDVHLEGGCSSGTSCYKSYIELLSDSESDVEDIELAAAIEASLQDTQPLNDDRNNEDVVRNIITKLAGRRSDGEPTTIVVHRKRLLASTMRAVSRPGFSFWTQVRIVFSGEDAEDGGGPRREFFNLLVKELQSSGIFENCEGRLSFKYDLQKISQRAYDMAGKLITWSLANGGPGLCSLSPSVFAAMVGQPVDTEDIRYLPDQMFQCNVEKLLGSKQEDFPAVIVELTDWLIDQGLTSIHKIDFADRDNLVKELVTHQIYHRVQSCIGQFTDGLGPLWEDVKGSPKASASLFIYDDHPLSVDVMRKLYKIEYSPPGSNNRNQEEDTIYCFEVFLQNCEDEITEVSLEDILEFWTGAPKPPPCGFSEDPKVSFFTAVSGIKRLPSSHTCGPILWLPRGKEDPDEFQAMMRFAIKETQGFGKI